MTLGGDVSRMGSISSSAPQTNRVLKCDVRTTRPAAIDARRGSAKSRERRSRGVAAATGRSFASFAFCRRVRRARGATLCSRGGAAAVAA